MWTYCITTFNSLYIFIVLTKTHGEYLLVWWKRKKYAFDGMMETEGIGWQKKCTLGRNVVHPWLSSRLRPYEWPVRVFTRLVLRALWKISPENLVTMRRRISDRPADGVASCLPLLRRPVIKNWMHSSAAATIEATGLLIVIISLSGSARVYGVCTCVCVCCVCNNNLLLAAAVVAVVAVAAAATATATRNRNI